MIVKSKLVLVISIVLSIISAAISFKTMDLISWSITVLLLCASILIAYYQHKEEKQKEREEAQKEQVDKLLWRFTDFKSTNTGNGNIFEIGIGGINVYLRSIDTHFTFEEILQLHKLGQLTEHDLEVIVKWKEYREQNNY